MLTIFRGDDLAFAEFNRKVCVRFNTCQDLTGWAAKFCLYDDVKIATDISSRFWSFGYTAEETQKFPLGKTYGKLLIFDQSGRIRQMAKVEVEVVNQKLEPCIAGFIAISVDNVVADYNNMGNKPVLNGKVIEGIHDSEYYGVAPYESIAQFQGLSDTVQMMSATVTDQGEAIANNYLQLVELKQKVDTLDPQDYSEQIAELRRQISSEATTRANEDQTLSSRIDSIDTDIQGKIDTAVEQEREERESAISGLATGTLPITQLLFEAEGDNDNYYRIKVVMRDDGAGHLLPALALDAIPRDDSSGDESST